MEGLGKDIGVCLCHLWGYDKMEDGGGCGSLSTSHIHQMREVGKDSVYRTWGTVQGWRLGGIGGRQVRQVDCETYR
jgi:hypothetical protein